MMGRENKTERKRLVIWPIILQAWPPSPTWIVKTWPPRWALPMTRGCAPSGEPFTPSASRSTCDVGCLCAHIQPVSWRTRLIFKWDPATYSVSDSWSAEKDVSLSKCGKCRSDSHLYSQLISCSVGCLIKPCEISNVEDRSPVQTSAYVSLGI